MAKTKKQGENSACSALFEHAYYSSGYGISFSVGTLMPQLGYSDFGKANI